MPKNNSTKKRFFIVDGYAFLYRAHYALIRNPLITSYGLHTSALFGFSNMIIKLIKKENPDYFACVFDSKGKTFRHKIYPDYKANRSEMPKEMQDQLVHLWEILEAMKIPVLKLIGIEADDIIGSLAKNAKAEGLQTYIVSGDKDFTQLVGKDVFLYAPPTKKSTEPIIYDIKKVEQKWGVPPSSIIDLLGLMGDSSDNIPGVPGIGPKTAVKLLSKYGNIENVLDNAENVANKRVKNGLSQNANDALLSKKLVTIITDIELEYGIKDLVRTEIDYKKTSKKFIDLEFQVLINALQTLTSQKSDYQNNENVKNYEIISTIENLDKMINDLFESVQFSFDLETTSLNPIDADIVGISFSNKANSGWYIPILYKNKSAGIFSDNDLNFVLNRLKKLFIDNSILKIGQNIKFDMLILKNHGIDVCGPIFDTLIAAHLINPVARSNSLNSLSYELLNYEMVPIEDLIGKGQNKITMDKVSLESIAFYATEDADITFQLAVLFKEKLKSLGLDEIFYTIEIPLIKVLIEMEYKGTYVDVDFLNKISSEIQKKIDALKTSIFKISGQEFNLNSTQQLANILFDNLNLPKIKKRSTAEDVLTELSIHHDLPKFLLEYRKYNKLKNTYLDTFPDQVNKKTGRIHTTFNQTIAATGRLSSTKPNFQNIPIRKKEGREIRRAFSTQKKGYKILSADYSQIELRIMAHLSGDESLCNAFRNNEDVHSRTASNVFNIPINKVLPEMRRIAKIVNFGIMYGAGPYRMSKELGLSIVDAKKIVDSYFQQYSGIKHYVKDTIEKAKKDNFIKTILGRRRPVWDLDSDNSIRRKAAERMAVNMPIQGSAAEMIKIAMINIYKKIKNKNMNAHMILQIHDELIFEYPIDEESEIINIVKTNMENALLLSVPIKVDFGIGSNWYEAH